ncbi:MAG: hypothetical protein AAGI91_02290 [Bacteroidota bacterium]
MEIELPTDFSAFLKSLSDHRVEYLLVGGYAVARHGYPRATNDMDVWVRMDAQNAERIVAALGDFGFGVSELRADAFLSKRSLIRMGYEPLRIEIMTTVSGVTFEECWPERVEDEWDGVPVTVIGLACLKKNKRASGRLKDLADLEELP